MIGHYLKTALRNLLKYKTHSFISVLCLAVGIVTFSLMHFFIHQLNNHSGLPEYQRLVELKLPPGRNGADTQFNADDVQLLQARRTHALDSLAAYSYLRKTEVNVTDKMLRETPFILNYRCVNSYFFSYFSMKLMHGPRLPKAPDEVVISRNLARKVTGGENPVGLTLQIVGSPMGRESSLRDLKVVNVVEDNPNRLNVDADLYMNLDANPGPSFTVKSRIAGDSGLEGLNKQLEQFSWDRNGERVYTRAYSISELENSGERLLIKTLLLCIVSLILLSGLINFLKFIIQMFYIRQRELALRKSMGSDTKGLFGLLFSEVFWMISFAFLLSLLLAEVTTNLLHGYVSAEDVPSFPLLKIYASQLRIYLILLLVCFLVALVPILCLRKVSIIRYEVRNTGRHLFRNIMIGIQLGISIFFAGGVMVLTLSFNDQFARRYSPLTPKEEARIITLSVNSQRMEQNIDAIISDIIALPDITDQFSSAHSVSPDSYVSVEYKRADGSESGFLTSFAGDPHYFSFFRIPMKGKEVGAEASGTVYVSEAFRAQLERDSVRGTVLLDDKNYRIAGSYKSLYKDYKKHNGIDGSVFFPDPKVSSFYFRVSDTGNVSETLRKITDICRRYVPQTLPLDIRMLDDTRQTLEGSIYLIRNIFIILAAISLLLVLLSVYSAISMDTRSRQKEVAIRKINGATPWIIARLFGKPYLIIFLLTFLVVYPLLRYTMIEATDGIEDFVYSWEWGVVLFIGIALLLFLITACKIYRIMHINPTEIIKNE